MVGITLNGERSRGGRSPRERRRTEIDSTNEPEVVRA